MERLKDNLARLGVIAVALCASGLAQAETAGETAQNRRFVSGGVSIEEAQALERQRNDYRLWLVTAARGTGAWLADAHAVLRDADGSVVLDTILQGPYLLVDLAPGRYTIEATVKGQKRTETVTVGSSGHRQLVMYFDQEVEVSPDRQERKPEPPASPAS